MWQAGARNDMFKEGAHLGPYDLIRQIGEGGMGQVYLAQHRRLHRRAAIKVLHPEIAANPQLVERFFIEARATASINHPGIVEVFDCDVSDGQAFIAMEYLEGETLDALIQREGNLSGHIALALGIMGQIADAVGAAHARNIVHRDLKPDNVFLLPSAEGKAIPHVKVVDFGIAKVVQSESEHRTRTGTVMGTPAYMSPEQCRGAGIMDHRSDIYSLGCIAYQILTGHPPFRREGFGDMLLAQMTEAPPALSDAAPGLPRELEDLIMAMLAKSPSDRPSSMEQVRAAIDTVNVTGTARPRPSSIALTPTQPFVSVPSTLPPSTRAGHTTLAPLTREARSPARRRRWIWAVGLVAIGIPVGGWLFTTKARPPAMVTNPSSNAPVPPPPIAKPNPAIIRVINPAPNLSAWLEGVVVDLPTKIPALAKAQKLVLTAPGYKPSTFTVDGSRNRDLDGDLEKISAAPAAPIETPKPKRHGVGAPRSRKTGQDREAITDI